VFRDDQFGAEAAGDFRVERSCGGAYGDQPDGEADLCVDEPGEGASRGEIIDQFAQRAPTAIV
jgi:hypothetical protein